MRSDWSKMWRVICSNTARAKCTQIFAQKSIHSLRLETLEAAKVSSKGREIPLNAIKKFVLSFSTALFSPIFDLFSKWQVEGKGSKTSTIVYFSTANDFANFPLWQSISRPECSSSILCVVLGQEIYLCLTILVKKVEFLRVSVLTVNLR